MRFNYSEYNFLIYTLSFITHTKTTIMSTEEPVQDVDVSMQDEEVEDLDTEKIKIVCLFRGSLRNVHWLLTIHN